jgi:hypothetical protein
MTEIKHCLLQLHFLTLLLMKRIASQFTFEFHDCHVKIKLLFLTLFKLLIQFVLQVLMPYLF